MGGNADAQSALDFPRPPVYDAGMTTHTYPRIGIHGGMGPLATADFLAKLTHATPALCDQDHFPVTVESAPQIPDRIAALEGRGDDPLPALLGVARRLTERD